MIPILIVSAIIVAIIVIIFIFTTISLQISKVKEYLPGLWVGDKKFLELSKLKDIQLFIAPQEDGEHQGYLVMVDLSGEFVSNQAIRLGNVDTSIVKAFTSAREIEHDINHICAEINFDEYEVMPSQIKLKLSILDGSLMLYDDTKIYALLIKDLNSSNIAKTAYEL
jgi:hypothetical protein